MIVIIKASEQALCATTSSNTNVTIILPCLRCQSIFSENRVCHRKERLMTGLKRLLMHVNVPYINTEFRNKLFGKSENIKN
jgi:hypothetical protein